MSKIGFGDQPYLVYQHFDARHPHIHIVTTNIKSDGSRIKTHNIGRNQSERARREIENNNCSQRSRRSADGSISSARTVVDFCLPPIGRFKVQDKNFE